MPNHMELDTDCLCMPHTEWLKKLYRNELSITGATNCLFAWTANNIYDQHQHVITVTATKINKPVAFSIINSWLFLVLHLNCFF